MKKLMMGVALWAVAALASATTYPNDSTVNVNGNPGSVQVSQCTSVFNGCDKPSLNVNFNGDVSTVNVDGKSTVIKGKDGKDGKDGLNGKDGAKGDKGDKGDTGAAGLNGTNGSDGAVGANGIDGKDGKDGVTTTVVKNVVDSKTQRQVQQNTSRINALEQRQDDDRKHASAGVAGVAAMANIPQVSQYRDFSIGAGVGSYDGEEALAVGMSARIDGRIVTKASVSATTQSDFVFGAGLSYEW